MKNFIIPLLGILFIASCSRTPEDLPPPVAPIEVVRVEAKRPKPIVPPIDQLDLRPVNWQIVTPNNVQEKFDGITRGEKVFFSITAEGYEALSLNISDIRAMIEQQQKIIEIYEKQF